VGRPIPVRGFVQPVKLCAMMRCTRDAGGGKQMIDALGAQGVGRGERLVEVAPAGHVGQRRHRVHDRARFGSRDRFTDGGRVQTVDNQRFGAEAVQLIDLAGVRVVATTSWPAARRRGTRRWPTAPVAPARKTRIIASSFDGSFP
jgi:hypothetical protein